MLKEFKIIFKYFTYSLQTQLTNIPIFLLFFIAKIIRYGLFLIFLYFLVNNISQIGGYSTNQMLLFYLTFNLIDTTSQMLFREIYRFRPQLVSGGFDFTLAKPINPLIRSLLGGPDFIDAGILLILLIVIASILFSNRLPYLQLTFYLLLIINSLVLATAFHICVLAIGILSLSVDHLVMVYRDLASLVRIPVDLFTDPLRSFITFVIPIGIMFTFPAKMLFGLLSWQLVVTSFVLGLVYLFLSLKFWHFALKHYSSASS
ncbi:hypothetical protein A2634_00335 [Candidatus Amesbacteria bacterium RIFCSPHIGHO2_01_FULL_48_32]|uniref:ABC transporter permease n=1 Tax=Candidatus Amesbacteria bacterium RIFCSPLOWO2_01_FULL_48_25 TaxID=1797259 RepID=A0A1F4ZBF4_9BACT|nr:MAG: hypothetical protein A2634_00335 [Candidatus Amesbacteria bacterium RIFCSPHIGHO2_01_FULL_48_32]OGD03256.1 MAG: hypothetical protein A2989_00285 [Candidatus Amesbacteria bacterium RIFCSPLOWO2_01_FULL_48_25]HJZ05203.1 ABC-2 family transporter protein [Patescibacteria group bacterium]